MELLHGYVCVSKSYTAGHYLFFCLYVIIICYCLPDYGGGCPYKCQGYPQYRLEGIQLGTYWKNTHESSAVAHEGPAYFIYGCSVKPRVIS